MTLSAVTLGHDGGMASHPFGVEQWPTGPDWFHAPRMTGEWDPDLVDYLRWSKQLRGLADNTLRVRIDLLRRLSEHIGIPLRQAQPEHLLSFERVAIAGRSAETRRVYAVHLRALYRWMLDKGLIERDPSVVLTLPVLPRRLPRPIPEDDLTLALNRARPKLRTMLTLAAYAGLRCCEVAGLEWPDLRRESDGRAYLHIREGKGGRDRVVEVGAIVVQALAAHGIRRRGPIFLGVDGGQITANAVSRAINRHLRNLGIDATAHQLRHRYATIAYELSRDLRLVQEMLGHSSPNTTAGYARPSADAAARMVAAMDALPAPRTGPDPAGLITRPTERTAP
jgi:integrase/recombinase XerC